jgi:hypothetical protein
MRSSNGRKRNSPAKGGTEGTRGEIQAAHIGNVGDLRLHRNRAFVVGAAGKTREAFFAEQNGEGVDADSVAGGSQFALHVIDRKITFTHGNRQITDPIAGRRRLRSALWLAEEGGAFLRVVAELMADDAEGARGIAEAARDFGRWLLIDEVSTEGFILALQRELGGEEEVLVARCR